MGYLIVRRVVSSRLTASTDFVTAPFLVATGSFGPNASVNRCPSPWHGSSPAATLVIWIERFAGQLSWTKSKKSRHTLKY